MDLKEDPAKSPVNYLWLQAWDVKLISITIWQLKKNKIHKHTQIKTAHKRDHPVCGCYWTPKLSQSLFIHVISGRNIVLFPRWHSCSYSQEHAWGQCRSLRGWWDRRWECYQWTALEDSHHRRAGASYWPPDDQTLHESGDTRRWGLILARQISCSIFVKLEGMTWQFWLSLGKICYSFHTFMWQTSTKSTLLMLKKR